MSNENDKWLRETFEKHRTFLHDKQLANDTAAAKDDDFARQYIAHRHHAARSRALEVVRATGRVTNSAR